MGFVEELINLIEKNEILYNKKCGGYKNIARKSEVWDEISKTLGKPVSDCIGKWKSLRDRFTKLHKEKKNQPSGSGFQFKQEWEYYESLTFLQDHIQPRKTISNYSASRSSTPMTDECGESQTLSFTGNIPEFEDFSYEEPTTLTDTSVDVPKSKKRKKNYSHEEMGGKIANTMTALQEYLNTNSAPKKNSNFAKSIDILLSNLTVDNKSKAEARIMEYVCKCQLENLKNGDVSNVKM